MLKTAKLFSLLAIIVASTTLGLFAPSQIAAAQAVEETTQNTEGFNAEPVVSALKANIYRNLLSECISMNKDWKDVTIQGGELSEYNWIRGASRNTPAGYASNWIGGGGDGAVSCQEVEDNLQTILAYLNPTFDATKGVQYACQLFVKPKTINDDDKDTEEGKNRCPQNKANSSSDYHQRDGTFHGLDDDNGEIWTSSAVNALKATIDSWGYQYTNELGTGIGPVQAYILNKTALLEQCGAQYRGIVENDASAPASGNVQLNIVNGQGDIHTVVYQIESDTNLDGPLGHISKNGGSGEKCSDIATAMNSFAEAYSQWLKKYPDLQEAGGEADFGDEESGSTCSVDGIGWIVCPISNSLAKGIDNIFDMMQFFLRVEPLSTNTSSGTYKAWSTFLGYANILFIILFLVVVYAQITGSGLTNYSIKKMIPRLIVGAILINTSYWICAIAVDASNLLGSSLQDAFMGIRASAVGEDVQIPTWDIVTTSILSGVAVGGVGWSAAVGAGGLVGLLWGLVPILATAALSIFVALLVLAARQALIILLIVLAPIAFAAYMLPNTQKWFDRWKDLFITLLVMFPIMSVLFGGSQLAATIIMNSADNMLTVLLALGVQVIPLAITPLVVKFSGGLLGRFAGMVNDPTKGPVDSVKNFSKGRQDIRRREAAGSDNPAFFARRLQGRENRRRKLDERGRTADTAADTRYEEFATTDPEILALRERARQLEARSSRATDTSAGMVSDALAIDPAAQAILASADQAKLDRKAADDNLESAIYPLVDAASRISTAEAEINKQGVQDSVEAGVRRGMNESVVARAETSKLEKATEESNLATRMTPLVAPGARTGAMEAEMRKKMSENTAAGATLDSLDPTLQGQEKDSELRLKMAEDRSKVNSNINADSDLKMQATASSEHLANVESRDKRDYEQAVAGTPPAGVSAATAANATQVREASKTIAGATDSARRVSDGAFSEEVLNNPGLAREMGGIDPNGAERQRASAAASENRAHNEIITNKVTLLEHEKTKNTQLYDNATNDTLSDEDREANVVLLAKNGSDKQVDDFYDYVNTMPPSEIKTTLSQQYVANIGSRRSPAVGESDLDNMRAGTNNTTIKEGWLKRAEKLNGSKAANDMSADRLDSLKAAIEDFKEGRITTADPAATRATLMAFSNSIDVYRKSERLKDSQPTVEIASRMDNIRDLIKTIS